MREDRPVTCGGGEVTLRHLLLHTSGIHDYVGDTPDGVRVTTDQLMQMIRSQSPVYDDGRLTGGSWGAYGLGMQVDAMDGHRPRVGMV